MALWACDGVQHPLPASGASSTCSYCWLLVTWCSKVIEQGCVLLLHVQVLGVDAALMVPRARAICDLLGRPHDAVSVALLHTCSNRSSSTADQKFVKSVNIISSTGMSCCLAAAFETVRFFTVQVTSV